MDRFQKKIGFFVPNMCNIWQHIHVGTDVLAYENEKKKREITAGGLAFVIDYESNFSTRFKAEICTLSACKRITFLGKRKGKFSHFKITYLTLYNGKERHLS
jgi:hypothetical protein